MAGRDARSGPNSHQAGRPRSGRGVEAGCRASEQKTHYYRCQCLGIGTIVGLRISKRIPANGSICCELAIKGKAHLLEEKPVSFFGGALQTESNIPRGIFGSGIDAHFFQPVSKEPKSERFDLASSFFLRLAVAHQTGKCRDFGNPPAIIFLLKLNFRSCHAVD